MKVIRPVFWSEFQCTGGKCTDNCCIGWEIGIDPDTAQKYQQVSGKLGERLKQSIQIQEGESCFRMDGNRCPFLNRENLCDLILGLGENDLCEICREHPRFYEWFGKWKEAGLGLCCEEAVRLLLSEEKPLEFESVQDDEEESFAVESLWLAELVQVREIIFKKLQDRRKNFGLRIREVLELAEQVQECMDHEDVGELERIIRELQEVSATPVVPRENRGYIHREEVTEKEKTPDRKQWQTAYENLLDIFSDMESMDERWPERLKQIKTALPKLYVNLEEFTVREKEWEYEWEHLAVYSIFRYFLKGIDDDDVLSKVRMAVAGCGMIRLLHLERWTKNGKLTLWDRICNIKAYSKELEYSPDNLEKLMDAVWDEKNVSAEALCCICPGIE